jgi:hypothetical protein
VPQGPENHKAQQDSIHSFLGTVVIDILSYYKGVELDGLNLSQFKYPNAKQRASYWARGRSQLWLQDGHALDEHGVHHRVLSAVVETAPGRDCFGIISVFSDRLELQGFDRLASATMHFLPQENALT